MMMWAKLGQNIPDDALSHPLGLIMLSQPIDAPRGSYESPPWGWLITLGIFYKKKRM